MGFSQGSAMPSEKWALRHVVEKLTRQTWRCTFFFFAQGERSRVPGPFGLSYFKTTRKITHLKLARVGWPFFGSTHSGRSTLLVWG